MGKTITVTIDETGNAKVQVDGVQGPSCQALTAELIDALVATKGDAKVKVCSEYYLQDGTRIVGQAPIRTHF